MERHTNASTGRRAAICALVGIALVASGAGAGEWVLGLDADRTQISFTLGATMHEVHGTLALARGEIRLDADSGGLAGEVVLAAASADTANERRDRDMHAKVLESEKFPNIVWKPRRLVGELSPGGEAAVEVEGSISIHGGEHPLSVPATVSLGEGEWSAVATLTIPYVDWGMKDPSKFVLRVAKVVEVEVKAAGPLTVAE